MAVSATALWSADEKQSIIPPPPPPPLPHHPSSYTVPFNRHLIPPRRLRKSIYDWRRSASPLPLPPSAAPRSSAVGSSKMAQRGSETAPAIAQNITIGARPSIVVPMVGPAITHAITIAIHPPISAQKVVPRLRAQQSQPRPSTWRPKKAAPTSWRRSRARLEWSGFWSGCARDV